MTDQSAALPIRMTSMNGDAMTIRLTPHTITEAINFVVAGNDRALKQILTDVQNADHAHHQKYAICRPLLASAHQAHYNQLQGMLFLMLDHHKVVEQIKAAQTICQQEWRLCDFQIVSLQRPGTHPPFYIKAVA